jgi:hypothetical protein
MTANDPAQLGDTGAASPRKVDAKAEQEKTPVGQATHAAHAVKDKAADAAQATKDKAGELVAKAHDAVTAEDVKPAVRRSGAGIVALGAGVFAVWAWRRRKSKNASPWEKAVRQTRAKVKATRGQARTQAKLAKSKVKAAKARARSLH